MSAKNLKKKKKSKGLLSSNSFGLGSNGSSSIGSSLSSMDDPECIKLFQQLTLDTQTKLNDNLVKNPITKKKSPFQSIRDQQKSSSHSTSCCSSSSKESKETLPFPTITSTHGDFINSCIERLEKGVLLREIEVKQLCNKAIEILSNESNIVRIQSPVTVVGDIHGQFYDVIEMFHIGGPLPLTNYLFLGDYVDRGKHSILTISLLICYKLRWPNRITLLRGNHETRLISKGYGFYNECIENYGNENVWRYFNQLFDYLTVCALIDDKIFCVHGGLSPSITAFDQIRVLDRFGEPGTEGPLIDLMWSDPDPERQGFGSNHSRGCGFLFGGDIVKKFLHFNGAIHMCRAHQLCDAGYKLLFDDQLSTVWSAPNYCYRCGNRASILEIDQDLNMYFNIFEEAPEEAREESNNNNTSRWVGINNKFQVETKANGGNGTPFYDWSQYFI
ncbi:hypothetical protein ABK040_002764 [Willaertia magna]